MCARVIRDETVCAKMRNTGRKLVLWGFGWEKFNPNTQTPRKLIPTKHAIWHKNGVDPLKNVVSEGELES